MTDTPTVRYAGKQSSADAFMGYSTIYGRGGDLDTPYLTRIWIGRLRLHIFFKGDQDTDPHDHPWDFWTFPLVPYEERVLDRDLLSLTTQTVPAWRVTFRPATHIHRVLGPKPGPIARWLGLPLITLVWRGKTRRSWGFWSFTSIRPGRPRYWIRWDRYFAQQDQTGGEE